MEEKCTVDINNATAKELEELDGVGPDEAQLILDARHVNILKLFLSNQ